MHTNNNNNNEEDEKNVSLNLYRVLVLNSNATTVNKKMNKEEEELNGNISCIVKPSTIQGADKGKLFLLFENKTTKKKNKVFLLQNQY